MTEYELDRWFAHQAEIDIANFPPYRPSHINKNAYEYLKKYATFNRVDSQNNKNANQNNDAEGSGSGTNKE